MHLPAWEALPAGAAAFPTPLFGGRRVPVIDAPAALRRGLGIEAISWTTRSDGLSLGTTLLSRRWHSAGGHSTLPQPGCFCPLVFVTVAFLS